MSCWCKGIFPNFVCVQCETERYWMSMPQEIQLKLLAVQDLVNRENHTVEELREFGDLNDKLYELDLSLADIPEGATLSGILDRKESA